MADLLKSFLAGNQAQKKLNAEAAETRRKAVLESAKYSQTVLNSAEEEFTKMMTALRSDNWDASQLPSLLNQAKTFDRTYGNVWQGKSAQRQILEALHMPVKPDFMGKSAWDKKRPEPGKMAGLATQKQVDLQNQRTREQNIFGAQQALLSYVKQFAFTPDGKPDPKKIGPAILNWESEALATGQYDREDLNSVVENVRTQLGDVVKQMNKGTSLDAELMQRQKDQSAMVTSYVRSLYAIDDGFGNLAIDSGDREKANAVRKFGQSLAAIGLYSDAFVKAKMIEKSVAVGAAKFDDLDIYEQNQMKMPPAAWSAVEAMYNNETYQDKYGRVRPITPAEWEPIYDPGSGKVELVNLDGTESIPVGREGVAYYPLATGVPTSEPAGYKPPKADMNLKKPAGPGETGGAKTKTATTNAKTDAAVPGSPWTIEQSNKDVKKATSWVKRQIGYLGASDELIRATEDYGIDTNEAQNAVDILTENGLGPISQEMIKMYVDGVSIEEIKRRTGR